jgi:hypothetical protein
MAGGQWTTAIGGSIGAVLALYGVRMLVTGRAPQVTSRAFRTVREAGLYHTLFGVALVLLVVGTNLTPGSMPATVSTLLAVAMVAIAVIRFRPRGRRSARQK